MVSPRAARPGPGAGRGLAAGGDGPGLRARRGPAGPEVLSGWCGLPNMPGYGEGGPPRTSVDRLRTVEYTGEPRGTTRRGCRGRGLRKLPSESAGGKKRLAPGLGSRELREAYQKISQGGRRHGEGRARVLAGGAAVSGPPAGPGLAGPRVADQAGPARRLLARGSAAWRSRLARDPAWTGRAPSAASPKIRVPGRSRTLRRLGRCRHGRAARTGRVPGPDGRSAASG